MNTALLILLLELLILSLVAVGLLTRYVLKQKKLRRDALNDLLSSITKNESSRLGQLDAALQAVGVSADQSNLAARQLILQEKKLFQQLIAAQLDNTGNKLSTFYTPVNLLVEQCLETLGKIERPNPDSALEHQAGTPSEAIANQPEADETEATGSQATDDIEVTLDLDDLDQDAADRSATEPESANEDSSLDDIEVAMDESDDDIEVTMDMDELIGDDAEASPEPSPSDAETETSTGDMDDIEVTMDLDALEEPAEEPAPSEPGQAAGSVFDDIEVALDEDVPTEDPVESVAASSPTETEQTEEDSNKTPSPAKSEAVDEETAADPEPAPPEMLAEESSESEPASAPASPTAAGDSETTEPAEAAQKTSPEAGPEQDAASTEAASMLSDEDLMDLGWLDEIDSNNQPESTSTNALKKIHPDD